MNKRNLLERRYIIEILGLILNGIKTNQKIADKLEKNRSTISDQVNFLKKNNLIFMVNKKRYNEIEYNVNLQKIIELFFKDYIERKKFLEFKKNFIIEGLFGGLISIKQGMKNNPKFKNVKIEEITLKNIFSEAYKLLLFTFRSEKKELITMRRDLPMYDTEGKKIFGISGFNFKANDEEKKEFLSFLDGLYKDHLKRKVEYRI